MSEYKVGEVARMSNVSVRTLHHYDAIGLLAPSGRSEAGYRLYSAEDLRRLRLILFYRELDFALDQVAAILLGPDARTDQHLRRQHQLLRARRDRTDLLLSAIETEMEARRMGISLTPEEQLEVFGTDKVAQYHREGEQRWGDTDAWKESQRRTAAYTKDDWLAIKQEADEHTAAFIEALNAGEAGASGLAMDLAEAHRRHVSRWYYECGYGQHCGLAALYVSDPRYGNSYDRLAPGLSLYVHDAIVANAKRARR